MKKIISIILACAVLFSMIAVQADEVTSGVCGDNITWRFEDKTIYFGPMGCQTGFYLLIRDENDNKTLEVIKDVLTKIINHNGEIFGNTREECGNYRNLNLEAAQIESQRFLDVLNSKEVTFKYE